MNHTEHNTTEITSPGAGFFAVLGDLLSRRGGGALSLASPRLGGRPALTVSLVLTGILWVGLSSAVASQSHAFLSAFGSAGAGAGQFELGGEAGVAVDQSTGNVYVADTGNHRVDEFTSSGAFIHAFGWGVKTGDTSGTGLDACTTASGCQAGFPGPEPGQFEQPTWVAVDNTPGGGGDLYVADHGSVANARQTITVSATGGSYMLSFTSTLHGAITSGSKLVTNVVGKFGVGDAVSGPGIPAGATIASRFNLSTFELSVSATATANGVILGAIETTASIAYNAPANKAEGTGSVEAALGALEGIGENGEGFASARVSRSAGGPYTVEFVGGLASTKISQMTADSSKLSGGTATVATVVEGKNTARVEKFDASGSSVSAWGGSPAPGEVDGTMCTDCGFYPHFDGPQGVGVKPDGKLLVLDHNPSEDSTDLFEFAQSSGEFIRRLGTFGYGQPIGIAVDPAGHLYLGKTGPPVPPFEVVQASYCEPGSPPGLCEEPAYHSNFLLTESAHATGVAVDPATEAVYVAQFNPTSGHSDVAAYHHEDNRLEVFGGGEITSTHEKEIAEASGIAASSKGDVYVADGGVNRVEVFAPGGPRDTLTVTRAGTGLGSVTSEPAGIACPFTCSGSFSEGEVLTLTASTPAHATFVGWSGGACAGAGVCVIVLGAETAVTATFVENRPVLASAPASGITRHSATLSGTVNPEGDASSCRFEYGPTSAYGADTPCSTLPGSDASPVPVSAGLWDLAASTIYHYRLVSANTGGATYGPDGTFTTLPESCAVNSALCPAFALAPALATVAVVSPKPPATTTTRTLTNAQKLARALKACRKQMRRSTRVSCERQARKRYPPARKKAKKSTRNGKRG